MKIVISILCLVLVAGCSFRMSHEQPVFDARLDTGFAVTGHYESVDSLIWIQDTSDVEDPPVFQLMGTWDLSEYSHIKVVLVNGNSRDLISATFTMGSGAPSGKKGELLSKNVLRGVEPIEWSIPILPAPENPEVLDRLTGMRATPFQIDGATSTLDRKKVTSVSLSFDKLVKGAKIGIKEISLVKGISAGVPKWFTMSSDDFFPFIDEYGQFIHKDWPGKTNNDQDLEADLTKELEDMKNNPPPTDRSSYGGWLNGKKQEAKGHFYVQKVAGKWWMVDPEGHLFWSHGVVRVTPSSAVTIIDGREDYFASLPDTASAFGEFYKTRDEFLYQYYKSWGVRQTFDFSAANLKRKYGKDWRESYTAMTGKRLQNWGMNTISAGSDKNIYRSIQVPYSDRIELNTPKIEGVPGGLNVIRDPFHPDFHKQLAERLLERKEELRSEWCYGYFIDNKLVWGADHDLGRWTLKSPGIQPAKRMFVKKLKDKYHTIGTLNAVWASDFESWDQLLLSQQEPPKKALKDCEDFSAVLIEAYFSNVALVMRQVAPGKLYLGCRYVTINDTVLRIASQYSDVLTFDLFVDSLDDFALPNGIDKPVLIGEFHFGALDRGLFHPGLNQKKSQEERGLAYEKYVKSALQNPFIVGTAWHQFSDQATTGRFDGENFQDGLTDVCDRAYPETISKVREIGHHLYSIRAN